MVKRVVGDTIQEDVARTYSRQESSQILTNARRKRDRLNEQVKNHQDAISALSAEISEWEAAISSLPALPTPEPAPPVV